MYGANLFDPPTLLYGVQGSIVLATGTVMERASPASPSTPKRARKIEVTEENIQRLFGMNMHDLFKKLAEKFGYTIED